MEKGVVDLGFFLWFDLNLTDEAALLAEAGFTQKGEEEGRGRRGGRSSSGRGGDGEPRFGGGGGGGSDGAFVLHALLEEMEE